MKIAIDAMGGDFAPASPVEGAIAALQEIPDDLQILLVGPREPLNNELDRLGQKANPRIEIVDADDVVSMTDKAGQAIRRKQGSSLLRAIQLHGSGDAHAVVSAGHTGVQMAASYMTLGLIEGVRRPAIGHLFPVMGGRYCFVVDVGANTDCKPVNLLQFAIMGSVFMEVFAGKTNPRVALLSIGEEKSKANELVSKTHYLLEESGLNFIGHVEGGDIFAGKTDVVVCDGFIGNILLKFAESVGFMFLSRLKDMCGGDLAHSEAARQFQKEFDYSEIGGVPLLGVNGISMICHGRSSGKAIKNAIREAVAFGKADLPKALAGGMEQYNLGMLARGRARLKRLQEKREQHDTNEDASELK
ncbi:MAG: phosphate acyltransferase PlsX [bacterium]|nr:phosphate acyltransferase PlsX [bacterium]